MLDSLLVVGGCDYYRCASLESIKQENQSKSFNNLFDIFSYSFSIIIVDSLADRTTESTNFLFCAVLLQCSLKLEILPVLS